MAMKRRHSSGTEEPDTWARRLVPGSDGPADERRWSGADGRVLVVGGGRVGGRLADGLAATRPVHHLDTDPDVVRGTEAYEASHATDLSAPAALAETGVTSGDLAVVMTGRDELTLLVVQQLRTRFDLEWLLVIVEDPRNREAFDIPGVEVVCTGTVLSEAVGSIALGDDGIDGERPPTAADPD